MAQNPAPFQRVAPQYTQQITLTPVGTFTIPADTGDGAFHPVQTLVQQAILGQIVNVQSVWLDATAAYDQVIIRNRQTRQYAVYPPGSYGWQMLLLTTDAMGFEFYCLSGATVTLDVSSAVIPPQLSFGNLVKSSPYSKRTDILAAAAETHCLAQTVGRQGFIAANDSTATMYLLCENGGSASVTNFTKIIQSQSDWTCPYAYGGEVHAYWTAANGYGRFTEFL